MHYEIICFVLCRNPEHIKRPTFSEICDHLLTSSGNKLLRVVEEPYMLPPGSKQLGAPLSEAKYLYQDLQNAYIL